MKLKQALLKLPDIDKGWKQSIDGLDGRVVETNISKRLKCILICDGFICLNKINDYHAAAKTFGYEIWWEPSGDGRYEAKFLNREYTMLDGTFKTPADAINAAFAAAVADKLGEMK